MDGFEELLRNHLIESGFLESEVITRGVGARTLPGFFRASKQWDLLVVRGSRVLAAIEFKSISSSFGNNLNNRIEEAIGSSTDFSTAFREGTFGDAHRPWLGYLLLMVAKEGSGGSLHPVRIDSPHVDPRSEFVGSSYARRGEQLCRKLVGEKLCDAAWFLVTPSDGGADGAFAEPVSDLSGRTFLDLLTGHARALSR